MGHIVNPVSFRLSVNSFWDSNWVLLNNFNYINVFKKDYLLFNYFNWWFNNSEVWTTNFLYSNYKIYRIYKKIIINIYYYDANTQIVRRAELKFFVWLFKFYLRRIWFYKRTSLIRNKIIYRKSWTKICKIFKFIFIRTELLAFRNQSTFLFSVSTLNGNNNFDDVSFNLYSMNVLNISVEAIVSYIGFRLQRKYSLNWVLRPVFKDLNLKMRRRRILGYKILCSGRFSREQIATYDWSHKGSLQYSTISSLVKYAEVRVRFKFGVGGVKLWLGYGCNNFRVVKRKIFLESIEYTPFKYSLKRFKNDKNNYIILYLNYWFFFFIRVMFFKKKKFSLYKSFVKFKIRWLLYFFIKRNVFFNDIKFSLINKPFKFSQKVKACDSDIIVWFKKYLHLICGKKYVTLRQIMLNLKKYGSKFNYRLIVAYIKRLNYLTYRRTLNKIIILFRLIWLKNTKLLIFFKINRWNYFFNIRKNAFNIFTKNENYLLKKFIN